MLIEQVPVLTYSVQDAMAIATPPILLGLLWAGIRRSGAEAAGRWKRGLATFFIIHSLLAVVPGLQGFYGRAPIAGTVYIGVVIAAVLIIATATAGRNAAFRNIWLNTSHSWLVLAHALRIVPGLVFLSTYEMGLVPGVNAIPAGYGDIMVGALAIPVGLALRSPGRSALAWARRWNWLGLLDLVWAVGSGMILIPARGLEVAEQWGAADHLNHLYVLPSLPVVLWVAMHLLFIWSLKAERFAEATGAAVGA